MNGLSVNGIAATSGKIFLPATGAWRVECTLETKVLPFGRVIVTFGNSVLLGTVNSEQSGIFGEYCKVLIIGGGGGWGKTVPAQHFKNDFGVLDSFVVSATAALVGEIAVIATPTLLGSDYVRTEGPASKVLSGLSWYVDAQGVTQTLPRIPLPLSQSFDLLEWNAGDNIATIAGDDLVWPKTILVDTRFGTAIIREVMHTIEGENFRITAYCDLGSDDSTEVSGARLARAIGTIAKAAIGDRLYGIYEYRVVLQEIDGRLTLQSAELGGSRPDILQSVPVWPGLPGVESLFLPGTLVSVGFLNGDPSKPIVENVSTGTPIEVSIDAVSIKAGGETPVVIMSTGPTGFATWVAAVSTALSLTPPATAVSLKLKA